MTVRVWLACHGLTAQARAGVFGADGEPEPATAAVLRRVRAALPAGGFAACRSPAVAATRTVDLLGLPEAPAVADLAEPDYGRWTGRDLATVAAADPAAVAAWTQDAAAAPPGGESLLDLLHRVSSWLDDAAGCGPRLVAVTGPAALRAAVVIAIAAPPQAFWRLDVEPLTVVRLSGRAGRWNLRLGPER